MYETKDKYRYVGIKTQDQQLVFLIRQAVENEIKRLEKSIAESKKGNLKEVLPLVREQMDLDKLKQFVATVEFKQR